MNTENKKNTIYLGNKILSKIFFKALLLVWILCFNIINVNSQNVDYVDDGNNKIGDFTSLDVYPQPIGSQKAETLKLPDTHTFQQIFYTEELSQSVFNIGLSAYVPDENTINEGFLCINNGVRASPNGGNGGVSVLNIEFNENCKKWEVNNFDNVNFLSVGGTSKNSSGAVTPWGTFISSENHEIDGNQVKDYNQETNEDGYYKYGWQVEINPAAPKVLGKRHEMGRFKHENAAVHPNRRTIYQGDDSDAFGSYLYKFVADNENDLTSGKLYVYKTDENATTGKWMLLDNKGPGDTNVAEDCDITENIDKWGSNNVKYQADCLGATVFKKIEDVEIGPYGKVYFICENVSENGTSRMVIYHLEDSDFDGSVTDSNPNQSTVNFLGVYIGGENANYQIQTESGAMLEVPRIDSIDNMEFDKAGNLYVCQFGTHGYIWKVERGHTSTNPKVKVMAVSPKNVSPKGITFSPDNRFMFLSLAPSFSGIDNTEEQLDALENAITFDKNMTLIISRKEHLGVDSHLDVNANATTETSLQSLYVSSQSIATEFTESEEVDVIIRANESVDLKSNHITLNEGFKVEAGGCLNAEIEPCTQ